MAAFTVLALADLLGISPAARPSGQRGAPKRIPLDFEAELAAEVEHRKRALDSGAQRQLDEKLGRFHFAAERGKRCSDADAIRSVALTRMHDRLLREGKTLAEANDLVESYSVSEEFERHVAGWKVRLSKYRASMQRQPQ
jgi:hypothetical protein